MLPTRRILREQQGRDFLVKYCTHAVIGDFQLS